MNRGAKHLLKKILLYCCIVVLILLSGYYIVSKTKVFAQHQYNKLISYLTNTARALNFKVNHIYIAGNNFTDIQDIKNQIETQGSIFNISINNIQIRLESLQWVKTAVVERRLPDTLYIIITEYKSAAIWQRNDQSVIITENGKIIGADDAQHPDLLVIIGQNAPDHLHELQEIIPQNWIPKIYSATLFSNRRWDIDFKNHLKLKLPEDDPKKAWKNFINMYSSVKDKKLIDLRIANKIFIK